MTITAPLQPGIVAVIQPPTALSPVLMGQGGSPPPNPAGSLLYLGSPLLYLGSHLIWSA